MGEGREGGKPQTPSPKSPPSPSLPHKGGERKTLLALSEWPALEGLADTAAEAEIGWVIDLVTAIRSIRAEMNIATAIPLVLAGVSAVFLVFYTQSISPSAHGNFYELYAIAAAVLGGCSLRGGEGSIVGIVLGTVLLQVLQNLVNLLGIPSSLNFAVMGAVILLGVLADQQLQRRRQRALALASAEARNLARQQAAGAT